MKTRYVIRESDFNKLVSNKHSRYYRVDGRYYNQATFTPITQYILDREAVLWELTDTTGRTNPYIWGKPIWMLFNLSDFLWNHRYRCWRSIIGDDAQLWLQSRKDIKPSRLGFVDFEYIPENDEAY